MSVAWARRSDRPRPVLAGAGRCLVMGIVNVTPDSFSDGGRFEQVGPAIGHGMRLAGEGADIVDVGGESTRPGAARVSARVELARVIPVVRELANAGVVVSIDTMRAEVAAAAVNAGAVVVNDISGGLADPAMASCVAELGVTYVAMHWRAHSAEMHAHAHYRDVVADVVAELGQRLDALTSAGVAVERIIVDPGIGFAKTAEQSWQVLRRLDALRGLGRPVLIGASRKSFLTTLRPVGTAATRTGGHDQASAAVTAIAAAGGAYCVRVHRVDASVVAVRVAAALR